jgi:zinc transporter 1/2/3
MDSPHLKLISIVLIFVVTWMAGAYPFKKRLSSAKGHDFPKAEALACGVFLGAGLIHMLGDASASFNELDYSYPFAFLITGASFLVLLWLEHVGREYYEHEGSASPAFAILAAFALSLHALFAGVALGLTNETSLQILILIAILGHKWAASFALSVQINKSNMLLRWGLLLFFIFSLMVPIGVVSGDLISQHLTHYPVFQPIFLSLAAGTFLYLGTLHGLSRAVMVQRCCNLRHFTLVIIGFALMAVVAVWS